MPVRAPVAASHLAGVALSSGLAAVVLWTIVLISEAPRFATLGEICGEPAGLFGHCALCWPAAALTAVALGALIALRRG